MMEGGENNGKETLYEKIDERWNGHELPIRYHDKIWWIDGIGSFTQLTPFILAWDIIKKRDKENEELKKNNGERHLRNHAAWIYENVYENADVESDEGGSHVAIGCCIGEMFEELTKKVEPAILDAEKEILPFLRMENGEWMLPEGSREAVKQINERKRSRCIDIVVQWLKPEREI